MRVAYYELVSGRSPPRDFIASLAEPFRGSIRADVHTLAEHSGSIHAPVQTKAIKGHAPLHEIKTGGYRTFYYCESDLLVVVHVCKKQDQKHGIAIAYKRMRELREG